MNLNTLALSVAIVLSLASGIISVLGLAAIFSGSYVGVIIVASILELAKVVTAAWLNRHWDQISKKLRYYLVAAVVVLMAITSLGIYGFFSRAHIEQQVTMATGDTSKIPILESNILGEKDKARGIDEQIKQINDALNAMTSKGKSGDAKKAIDEATKQRKTIEELRTQKNDYLLKASEYEQQKLLLTNEKKKHEIEVGPLKYLANLYYGSANTDQMEHAVRMLILVLVFVFDPLAIALVIAAGHSFEKPKPKILDPPKPAVPDRSVDNSPSNPIRLGRKAFSTKPTKRQKREKFVAKQNRDKVLNLNRLKLG